MLILTSLRTIFPTVKGNDFNFVLCAMPYSNLQILSILPVTHVLANPVYCMVYTRSR